MKSFLRAFSVEALNVFRMLPWWLNLLALVVGFSLLYGGLEASGLVSSRPASVQPKSVVEVIKHEELPPAPADSRTLHNYHILIKLPKSDTTTVFTAVRECQAFFCPDGHCNLNFYDSRKAYALNKEKEFLFLSDESPYSGYPEGEKQKLRDDWEQRNRNFVSEHFVAVAPLDGGQLQYYPYKDQLYTRLSSAKRVQASNQDEVNDWP